MLCPAPAQYLNQCPDTGVVKTFIHLFRLYNGLAGCATPGGAMVSKAGTALLFWGPRQQQARIT